MAEAARDFLKKELRDIEIPKKTWIPCICPACRKEHKRRLLWQGDLPTRKLWKHCDSCADYFSKNGSSFLETHESVSYSERSPAAFASE